MSGSFESEPTVEYELDPVTKQRVAGLRDTVIEHTKDMPLNRYNRRVFSSNRHLHLIHDLPERLYRIVVNDTDIEPAGSLDRAIRQNSLKQGIDKFGSLRKGLEINDALQIVSAEIFVVNGMEAASVYVSRDAIGEFVAGLEFRVNK